MELAGRTGSVPTTSTVHQTLSHSSTNCSLIPEHWSVPPSLGALVPCTLYMEWTTGLQNAMLSAPPSSSLPAVPNNSTLATARLLQVSVATREVSGG